MLLAVQRAQKNFRAFLKLQREMAGFATWKELAARANLGPATVNRLVKESPRGPFQTGLNSRNQFAVALNHADWWHLVGMWEKDWKGKDVPDAVAEEDRLVEIEMPETLATKLRAEAKAHNVSVPDMFDALIRLAERMSEEEFNRHLASARSKPLSKDRGTTRRGPGMRIAAKKEE